MHYGCYKLSESGWNVDKVFSLLLINVSFPVTIIKLFLPSSCMSVNQFILRLIRLMFLLLLVGM